MAKGDFKVWKSPHGQHGLVRWARLGAGSTFCAGEPVRLNNAGDLVECSDATATGTDLGGIALASGDIVGATDTAGTFRWRLGAFAPGTGFPAEGDLVPYVVPTTDTEFITANWDSATDGTLNAPVANVIGSTAGIQLSGGQWSLSGATDPALCRVQDVLDVNFIPISQSGAAGKYVVFTINAHQSASVAVITDAS